MNLSKLVFPSKDASQANMAPVIERGVSLEELLFAFALSGASSRLESERDAVEFAKRTVEYIKNPEAPAEVVLAEPAPEESSPSRKKGIFS
jgi:hypothetical protein